MNTRFTHCLFLKTSLGGLALGLCLSSAAWAGKAKPEVEVSGLLFAH